MSSNRRPHVFIPSLPLHAQQPAVPRGPVSSDYTFQVSPPHPSSRQDTSASGSTLSPQLSPLRRQPSQMILPQRPRIQSASDVYPTTTTPISFPEPQSYRSISTSRLSLPSNHSVASFASSYAEEDYGLSSPEVCSPISSLLSPY